MSVTQFKHAVVVLGMHRSGTSALAGMLGLAGLDMPRTLLPPSSGNEKGFWESEAIKSFDEDVLKEFGSSWHGVEAISLSNLSRSAISRLRKTAKEILADEYQGSPAITLKDPRMCRLLPIWQPVLSELSDRTSYSIILRNPIEVAQSLARRNEFDPDIGTLLWLRYLLDAEFSTRGSPRVFLTFNGLLADWRAEMSRLGSKLELPFDPDTIDADQAGDFLESGLRHHRIADEQAFLELRNLPQVVDAYRILLGFADDHPQSDAEYEALDRIRHDLDRMSSVIASVTERARLDRKRFIGARAQSEKAAEELAQAKRASENLEALTETVAAQSEAQARLEERLEAAVTSLSAALNERVALESSVREAIDAQRALQAQLDQLRGEAARAVALRQQEIQNARENFAALELQHTQESRESSERLEALAQERKDLNTELKDVKRKYRSTQHQLAREQEKLRKWRNRFEEAEATIATIRQSFGWRVSAKATALLKKARSVARRAVSGGDRKLREREIAQIRSSPYFDPSWYLSRYSDVAGSGIDPALHFFQSGWREGRDPGPEFSTSSYLKANPDVAKSGRNPILHYIEFGQSEGRSASPRSKIAVDPIAATFNAEFGPAAPCASFEISTPPPLRWTRSARIQAGRADLLSIGDVHVGYAADGELVASVRRAFDQLSRLSGYSGQAVREAREPPEGAKLIDAWLTGDGRLRTRWSVGGEPLVVRAYQHVVEKSGALELAGEALLRSDVDFLDARLRNPMFPVLLVSSEPDGTIRGSTLFAFPSLARGGLHYSELLALSGKPDGPVDILAHDRVLAGQLFELLDGEGDPLIGSISLDLSGADGSGPLFQSDARPWLRNVMRVGIDPAKPKNYQRNADYLVEAARLTGSREKAAGKLALAADMAPTISALVAATGDGVAVQSEVVLPMLLAGPASSSPATLVQVPLVGADVLKSEALNSLNWCRFSPERPCGLDQATPIGAIRASSRVPADAELLFPVAQPIQIVKPSRTEITWMIAVDDAGDGQLAQTLEALSLQVESAPSAVVLIGEVNAETFSLAKSLFNDRAAVLPEVDIALAEVNTPLVGYVAPDVILHDDRTSQVLATILEDPAAASSSCVIVTTERRGKGWNVSIVDGGLISGDAGTGDASGPKHFWRANYPAAWPARDLWVARTADVRGWLQRAGPLQAREGMHVCTSLVTAAYVSETHDQVPLLRPPGAQSAIRLEPIL